MHAKYPRSHSCDQSVARYQLVQSGPLSLLACTGKFLFLIEKKLPQGDAWTQGGFLRLGQPGFWCNSFPLMMFPFFPRARGLLIPDQLEWCNRDILCGTCRNFDISRTGGKVARQGRRSAHAPMAMAHGPVTVEPTGALGLAIR